MRKKEERAEVIDGNRAVAATRQGTGYLQRTPLGLSGMESSISMRAAGTRAHADV
jgi:phage-related protein